MIRILHVFGWLDRGGAEAVIMELYRHIDRSKVQFDFVVHTSRKCEYNDEIVSLGGRIFSVPSFSLKTLISYKKAWKVLLESHSEWRIIHGHVRSTASIYLSIAKKLGRYTIAHSHSISSGKGLSAHVKNALQKRIVADYYFACSKKAGEWLFGKKINNSNYSTLPNAIDTEKYSFDKNVRSSVRREFGCGKSIVIGHVGNFYDVKNHSFLLSVFYELQKCYDAKLMLVGDGTLRQEIEEKINDLGINAKVDILGVRNDVFRLFQAMDFFVFPSKYEGLGVVLIEAQTSGLPCVMSDKVPDEAIVTSNLVSVMSLDKSVDEWADHIISRLGEERYSRIDEVKAHGYDIRDTAKWLEEFYLSINNRFEAKNDKEQTNP